MWKPSVYKLPEWICWYPSPFGNGNAYTTIAIVIENTLLCVSLFGRTLVLFLLILNIQLRFWCNITKTKLAYFYRVFEKPLWHILFGENFTKRVVIVLCAIFHTYNIYNEICIFDLFIMALYYCRNISI